MCRENGFDFQGFPSEPIYSWKRPQGWRAFYNIWRSAAMARKRMIEWGADAVFSTGGYSSAPVVQGAKEARIPYVIHEQNTVPGRTNRILGKHAFAIATTFKTGHENFPGVRVERTGMPIRRELRASAQGSLFAHSTPDTKPLVMVMGGSQGAVVLNESAMACAIRMVSSGVHWLIVAGVKNYDGMHASMKKLGIGDEFDLRAYLNAEEMAASLFQASIIVCRSGGSLAELAAFRKPSILIPLPSSMGNHQYFNAKEFADMGAAMILEQKDLSSSTLEARIHAWLDDREAYAAAEKALADWDMPDAVERILRLVEEAGAR